MRWVGRSQARKRMKLRPTGVRWIALWRASNPPFTMKISSSVQPSFLQALRSSAPRASAVTEALRPSLSSSFEPAVAARPMQLIAPKGPPPTFTGFDDTKLAEPLKLQADGQPKSAKYTFAKLAQASGEMPRSKAEAELWFKQHIQGGLEQAGFAVGWVKGDKALICTRENPAGEVVDFMRGADSNDPNYQALAWQPEGGSTAAPAGASTSSAMLNSSWQALFAELLEGLEPEKRDALVNAARKRGLDVG